MKYTKLKAVVRGTNEGKEFKTGLDFTLIPPEDGKAHYGTGYYMLVEFDNGNYNYVDVRYERTTDIEILAYRFMVGYYGENAKEIETVSVE